jgi:hypothetical protein
MATDIRLRAFDAATALVTADSFHEAAMHLEGIVAQTQDGMRSPGINLTTDMMRRMMGQMAVPVVLHAFALEIVLKVRLFQATGTERKTHYHDEIFALLPEAERKTLCERYATERNTKIRFTSATLEEALQRSRQTFDDWRYRYELPGVNTSVGELILAFRVIREGL